MIKKMKTVALFMAVILGLTAFYIAPVLVNAGAAGVAAIINPNAPAVIHTGSFTAAQAKQWNAEISAAWNSPLNDRDAIIAAGGTYTASNPFGIDTSEFMYDVVTGEVIGPNPGYLQPMGYGDSCSAATYYTTQGRNIPNPTSCSPEDRPVLTIEYTCNECDGKPGWVITNNSDKKAVITYKVNGKVEKKSVSIKAGESFYLKNNKWNHPESSSLEIITLNGESFTYKVDAFACRDHDDNGHGNDDDHDDDSNPGQGGGNHGANG